MSSRFYLCVVPLADVNMLRKLTLAELEVVYPQAVEDDYVMFVELPLTTGSVCVGELNYKLVRELVVGGTQLFTDPTVTAVVEDAAVVVGQRGLRLVIDDFVKRVVDNYVKLIVDSDRARLKYIREVYAEWANDLAVTPDGRSMTNSLFLEYIVFELTRLFMDTDWSTSTCVLMEW